jgi:hypothetical protein
MTAFDVNKNLICSFSKFKGYAAVEQFCWGSNLDVMSHGSYYSHMESLWMKQLYLQQERLMMLGNMWKVHVQENP